MLQAFEIERFRTFRHLRIDRLARVNLIVGRNNVGKTMLLEALRLYADGAQEVSLARLLAEREEFAPRIGAPVGGGDGNDTVPLISTLFHGGSPVEGQAGAIRLADPMEDYPALTIEYESHFPGRREPLPRLTVLRYNTASTFTAADLAWPVERGIRGARLWPPFLPAHGMDPASIGRAWDSLALTTGEDQVLHFLRLMEPVERISLIQHPAYRAERIVMVRMAGRSEPMPLRRLGDGMVRVFELAIALEIARSGLPRSERDPGDAVLDAPMLLVDEIEAGIHYTALPEVWRFLLRASREAGVQVFASTHSWDAIEALQQAAVGEPDGSAMLIRLEQRGDAHRAVLFDQSELPLVTKHHVEVR